MDDGFIVALLIILAVIGFVTIIGLLSGVIEIKNPDKEIQEACIAIGCDSGEMIKELGIQCYKTKAICYTPNLCQNTTEPCKFITTIKKEV